MLKVVGRPSQALKNNAKRNWDLISVRDDLLLLTGELNPKTSISLEIEPSVVQYFFCLDGQASIVFTPSQYQLELKEGENYFFYNPAKALNPVIRGTDGTRMVGIFCSLEKIHQLFMGNAEELHFLKGNNPSQKYYKKDVNTPSLQIVLNQLMQPNVQGHAADVFRFAKMLEALSIYFSEEAKKDNEYCPYLNDEDSVRKIKQAKEMLIGKMDNPPTIQQLSKDVGLNEHRLKEGFKSLYGATIFAYLLDYKMSYGRRMLDSQKYKVQDVAFALGYNNSSHFITAFKNKFGVTPKKYLQNR